MFHRNPLFLAVACGLALTHASLHAEDISAELSEFNKKLQSVPSERRDEYNRSLSTQVSSLEAAIKQGNYQRAQQQLSNLSSSGYGVPADLQTTWQALLDKLVVQINEQQQASVLAWKKAVDALAVKTSKVCLEAKTSDDLDEEMIEIAALQLKRSSTDNLLAQRANQKLEGTARFVDQWCRFLDFKAAGDAKQANNVLRNILQGSNDFPLLNTEQIQKEFQPIEENLTNSSDIARVAFSDVKSVDDLPKAAEKLEQIQAKNRGSNSDWSSSWKPGDILLLVTANDQIKAGDLSGAEQSLRSLESSSLYHSSNQWLQPIRESLSLQIAASKVQKLTGTERKADESLSAMLARTMEALKAEGKYQAMGNLITEVSKLQLGRAGSTIDYPWSNSDSAALLAYASATQFEKAGDVWPAINDYRRVISIGQSGKYAPTAEAQQALERLKASNPQVFTDANSAVYNEIRQLRQDMEVIMRSLRSTPYRPPGMPGGMPPGMPGGMNQ